MNTEMPTPDKGNGGTEGRGFAETTRIDEIDGRTVEGCEALVNHASFSHTRMGTGCWRDVVWIYHHDHKSPSGFRLVGSTTEAVLYSSRRPTGSAALSPHESR